MRRCASRRAKRSGTILLPGAAPELLRGVRVGFGYAWRARWWGAELLAAASGLGYLIEDASALGQTDRVMVGILVIALLRIAADAPLMRVLSGLVPKAKGPRGSGDQSRRKGQGPAGPCADRRPVEVRFEGVTKRYPKATPLADLSYVGSRPRDGPFSGARAAEDDAPLKIAAGLIMPDAGTIEGRPERTAIVFQAPAPPLEEPRGKRRARAHARTHVRRRALRAPSGARHGGPRETVRATPRTSSRADRPNARRSRAPWRRARGFCFSTNPSARSMR